MVTRCTYDGAGNGLTRTLAADSSQVAATFVSTTDPGVTGSGSVTGTPGTGFSSYALVLGAGAPLTAGTYTVTLRGVGEAADLVLDTSEIILGGTPLTAPSAA